MEWYNSLFDAHQLDFILLPAAHNATPDLAQALSATIPAIDEKGEATTSDALQSVYPINGTLKNIHIPKLAIPTGLTEDGRPTGVQLWGRAVPYEEMYEDYHSAKYNIPFLHLASRVVKLIEDAGLQRVTPCMARDLFSESWFGRWKKHVPQTHLVAGCVRFTFNGLKNLKKSCSLYQGTGWHFFSGTKAIALCNYRSSWFPGRPCIQKARLILNGCFCHFFRFDVRLWALLSLRNRLRLTVDGKDGGCWADSNEVIQCWSKCLHILLAIHQTHADLDTFFAPVFLVHRFFGRPVQQTPKVESSKSDQFSESLTCSVSILASTWPFRITFAHKIQQQLFQNKTVSCVSFRAWQLLRFLICFLNLDLIQSKKPPKPKSESFSPWASALRHGSNLLCEPWRKGSGGSTDQIRIESTKWIQSNRPGCKWSSKASCISSDFTKMLKNLVGNIPWNSGRHETSGFAKVRPSVLLRLKQLHEACVLQMEQRENPFTIQLWNYANSFSKYPLLVWKIHWHLHCVCLHFLARKACRNGDLVSLKRSLEEVE